MKSLIFFILFCNIAIISCTKEKLTETSFSGLTPFNKIEFNSSFDVYLTEDSTYAIKIIANEDVIKNIHFKIDNNILTFNNETNYKWVSPTKNKIEIYIHSKQLSKIDANQTCNIKTLNPITSDEFGIIFHNKANEANLELNCKKVYYWNDFPCGGRLTLRGKTDAINIWNTGLTTVDAKDLTANIAHVENKSNGDCIMTIMNKLEYSIYGSGNIQLYGSPAEIIKILVSSSGRLIQY